MNDRPVRPVVYAIPLEAKRMPWIAVVGIGVAGAALGLIFGFMAMAMTSRTGRLPLPQSVSLQVLFPIAAIWWHTAGKVLGANTLVFFGQFGLYGFVIGLFAARGNFKQATAVVFLVHMSAYAVCAVFGLR